MICAGLNKYVTEMSEAKQKNRDDASGARAGKLAAKARPKQASLPMSSFLKAEIPFNMREWIDVESGSYDKSYFEVSKKSSDCFDTILQYFEKKTEQLNSKFWRRCLSHKSSLHRNGQFEHV